MKKNNGEKTKYLIISNFRSVNNTFQDIYEKILHQFSIY